MPHHTKQLIGISLLVALAFALRFLLLRNTTYDIYTHSVYVIVRLNVIWFWLLIAAACIWSVITLRTTSLRHS
jgi:hypothetical protein